MKLGPSCPYWNVCLENARDTYHLDLRSLITCHSGASGIIGRLNSQNIAKGDYSDVDTQGLSSRKL